FNPPHLGHLALARCAREELGLAEVVLMPASASPQKGPEEDPGPEVRLEMCRLAARDVEGLGVCAAEVRRGGTSYTVETLRELRRERPGARPRLILGADTACTLPSWREPEGVLELAELAVAEREGRGREAVLDALGPLHAEGRVSFLEMPPVGVSSSLVRARAGRGEPVEDLVGGALGAYIAQRRLYRADAGAGTDTSAGA
ncbi:MAG TPA: nicotinate (nicotinamide) nucleotide adenylyltransferase, partial [Solirubrobacteraceae bacterium]|nr:nicotinate (nicotinamide) nucleotide adenylyltransferase [Solirubrobacteraceae bacterium]